MLIFLALMGIVFQAVFSWAAPLQDAIESALAWSGMQVGSLMGEGDLRSLIVDGVIAGVGGVLVFLPQIAILFLFIGVLEDSGYMARAAFLMDRYMRTVGLHGRSFIPLVSGFACAVPAIMATRTIERPRDRLATIMVVPLMSCSARLPVYTLLIGAFVPALHVGGVLDLHGLVLLGMYLLGTLSALAVAFVFRRTLLRGQTQPLILELPPYRIPSPRALATTVFHRSSLFVRRAGTVILALSIVIWALATYPRTEVPAGVADEAAQELQLANSYLGRAGHAIAPAVAPLGFDWKIGVSIVSSFAAREVFVSAMGTIYGVGGSEDGAGLPEKLRAERDPRDGRAGIRPRHGDRADGVLRVRTHVHEHRGDLDSRGRRRMDWREMGGRAVRLHAGAGVPRRVARPRERQRVRVGVSDVARGADGRRRACSSPAQRCTWRARCGCRWPRHAASRHAAACGADGCCK